MVLMVISFLCDIVNIISVSNLTDFLIAELVSLNNKDVRIGKNDLRLKLMQKNVLRRSQIDDDGKFVDLREKLSRTGQPPHSSLRTRQPMPESKETSILGRIPVTRSTDALPQMNSSRSSYSAWTLDHIRRRSPESIVGSSRGLSPPRNVEDLQRRPLSRTFDDVRAVPYMSKDVHNTPRPVSTSSYMAKPTLPTGSVKPLPPGAPLLGQLPPPTGIVQKSSYAVRAPFLCFQTHLSTHKKFCCSRCNYIPLEKQIYKCSFSFAT